MQELHDKRLMPLWACGHMLYSIILYCIFGKMHPYGTIYDVLVNAHKHFLQIQSASNGLEMV